MANPEGNILFHIVWNAIDGLVLQLSCALHNEMGAVASEIMKNDQNSTCELKIQIASVKGCPSEFTSKKAVIFNPMRTKFLSIKCDDEWLVETIALSKGSIALKQSLLRKYEFFPLLPVSFKEIIHFVFSTIECRRLTEFWFFWRDTLETETAELMFLKFLHQRLARIW